MCKILEKLYKNATQIIRKGTTDTVPPIIDSKIEHALKIMKNKALVEDWIVMKMLKVV